VNVIRSSNSGIDRIALADGWEGEAFPEFPLLRFGRCSWAKLGYYANDNHGGRREPEVECLDLGSATTTTTPSLARRRRL
jgi:hypothetical protein